MLLLCREKQLERQADKSRPRWEWPGRAPEPRVLSGFPPVWAPGLDDLQA